MTEQTHTPGPWRMNKRGHHWEVVHEAAGGTLVLHTGMDDANARLIAAAPAMLAALEDLNDLPCRHPRGQCAKGPPHVCGPCAARQAIAKAKGEA